MHPSLEVRLLKLDESRKVKPAPLQHLSLTRGVQQVPSNEDRLKALRPFLPAEFGNARAWGK